MNIIIRPVKLEDAEGINLLRRMPGIFESTLTIPSQRINIDHSKIINLTQNDYQFVAILQEKDKSELLIGTSSLVIPNNPRLRHSASIMLMVHKDYQNKGVGTKLLETILDIADNWLMLVRIELGVFFDNLPAIHLYEKCGFKREGIKVKAAIRNGEYVDEIIMARIKH
ncbi:putative acetyltransferase [Clostridium collagenovorans DSM 3089]|uniref:Putative acetyltransferase n=1 Tax=Clostridium collagenovorans DSM 3089 TaxID=1121306 RepID=A0A1M5YGW5_9CLOT|nr:GNAT family N-acetyltransferase [Clostridium collagenovorans]SHI10723.1 putative acetyltransferase [Clostridium collagenovorans DSM 3089]